MYFYWFKLGLCIFIIGMLIVLAATVVIKWGNDERAQQMDNE